MVGLAKPCVYATIFIAIISFTEAQTQTVHLNLGPVRGSANSYPLQLEALAALGRINSRPDEIYCTDSTYANDIYCVLGNELDPERQLTDISMEYAHPSVKGETCTVNFMPYGSPSTSLLHYRGVRCTGRAPALPMTRVAYVLNVVVGSRFPEEQYRCTRSYLNSGKIGNMRVMSPLERDKAPLRFTFFEESCPE